MYIKLSNPRFHFGLTSRTGEAPSEYVNFNAEFAEGLDVSVLGRGAMKAGTATITRRIAEDLHGPMLLFEGSEDASTANVYNQFGCNIAIESTQFDRLMLHLTQANDLLLNFWVPTGQEVLRAISPNGDSYEWDLAKGKHVNLTNSVSLQFTGKCVELASVEEHQAAPAPYISRESMDRELLTHITAATTLLLSIRSIMRWAVCILAALLVIALLR